MQLSRALPLKNLLRSFLRRVLDGPIRANRLIIANRFRVPDHKTFLCQVHVTNCNFGNFPEFFRRYVAHWPQLHIVYASVCYNIGFAICPNTSASNMVLFGNEPQDDRGGNSHRVVAKSVRRKATTLPYTV